MNQPTLRPTTKVGTGAATAATVVILVWVAGMLGVEVPAEVASAAAVLLGFGAAYVVRDRA